MYVTPRAYKKAANDQEGERRGTSATATVNEKSSLFFDLSSKTGQFLKTLNFWIRVL